MKNLTAVPFRAPTEFQFQGLVSRRARFQHWHMDARVAQDSLVLTQLTHNDASALGIVMALQFAPQLLLLPWTGFAADHFNQRRLLMVTQAAMGVLALALGALTVLGVIQLWHVYVFALVFGSATALDAPVRQTFVGELVGDEDLPSAVSLDSTSFSVARMVGPAAAIMAVGTITGALLAGAIRPQFGSLLFGATIFGTGCTLGAIAPGYWWFAGALVIVGVAALTVTNSTNSMIQLSTEPTMRGRVLRFVLLLP